MNQDSSLTRRSFIKAGLALIAYNALPSFAYAHITKQPTRSLHLHNIHTGESIKTIYWEEGVYITESMKDISYILRDHHTNDMKDINPHLLDIVSYLHRALDTSRPFEVISGYRSPHTNAMLCRYSRGVNPHSLHMEGKAIDLRLGNKHLKTIRNKAVAMHQGGVGYYPRSDFVHLDVGPVKYWKLS